MMTWEVQYSKWVRKELINAQNKGKKIITFIAEKFEMNDKWEFLLQDTHYEYGSENWNNAINRVIASLKKGEDESENEELIPQKNKKANYDVTPMISEAQEHCCNQSATSENTVRVNKKTDSVRCPRCKSARVKKADYADGLKAGAWVTMVLVVLLAVAALCLLMLSIPGMMLEADLLALDYKNWEYFIKENIFLSAIIDIEGDISDQLMLYAYVLLSMALFMLILEITLRKNAAKSYRLRLVHTYRGMEAIPYSCLNCDEEFTVLVPMHDEECVSQ